MNDETRKIHKCQGCGGCLPEELREEMVAADFRIVGIFEVEETGDLHEKMLGGFHSLEKAQEMAEVAFAFFGEELAAVEVQIRHGVDGEIN